VNPPANREVHVWWAFPDQVCRPEILERQLAALSADERRQHSRFVFERHRRQYLVSHALVRDALSRYAPVGPADWSFEANQFGRPSIAQPAEWRGLRFNLSHTEGRSVIAVAWETDIGVDVEATAAARDLSEIADRFFSPIEIAQLKQRPDRFFDFWTLKEAYIKARGMGLAIPLNTFSFLLPECADPQIVLHQGCEDSAERWQFVLQRGSQYRMALAAAFGSGPRFTIVEREMVPFADTSPIGRYP
jgi:4'-phosphopantetheinyl transferase